MKIQSLILLAVLVVTACSEEKSPYNLEKKNQKEVQLKVGEKEKFVKEFFSKLPTTTVNSYWFRNGYQPAENLYLGKLSDNYESIQVGAEPKNGFDISSPPIVADGKIFTLGGGGEIQARSIKNPEELIWEHVIDSKYNTSSKKHGVWRDFTSLYMDADEFLGGSISYGLGLIFGASRRGNVIALDSKTGKLVWERKIDSPIRSAPSARDGKVIVTTLNNRAFALDTITGEIIWQHEGLGGRTNVAGSPSPLIVDKKVIVTYSSGEIFALDFDTGAEIWSTLTSATFSNAVNATISDIVNSPIIHKGALIFVTSDGRMLLVNAEDGSTIWETKNLALNGQPWPVDDSIFVINRFGDLLDVDFKTGRIVWRKPMADPEDIDSDDLIFTSPIMASDNIYTADNQGVLRAYSTKGGNIITEYDISSEVYIAPIVAESRMLLINNKSELLLMR